MASRKRKKPARAKPVLHTTYAWAVTYRGHLEIYDLYWTRERAIFKAAVRNRMTNQKNAFVVKVEVREVAPKRRKRGAK